MPDTEGDVKRVEIKLDLDQLTKIIDVGIRRASAFLKLGMQIADLEIPPDMSLAGGIAFNFWPKNLSEDVKESIRTEFRAWLIGSCLRELDQHLSMFLDVAWRTIEWSDLHGQRLPSSEILEFDKRYIADTNVARKFAALADKIKADLALDCHSSLSLARNSLAHGLGRVRERDCNCDGALTVAWIAPEMIIRDGDEEIVVRGEVFDAYTVKSPEGAHVGIRFSRHSKTFKIGNRIEFSQHELAEICFFYKQQADVARKGILDYLQSIGILSDISPVHAKELEGVTQA